MVDDFRVYSVELNSAEINEIYNDDLPVALLPFVSSDNQNRRIQTLTINFKQWLERKRHGAWPWMISP